MFKIYNIIKWQRKFQTYFIIWKQNIKVYISLEMVDKSQNQCLGDKIQQIQFLDLSWMGYGRI